VLTHKLRQPRLQVKPALAAQVETEETVTDWVSTLSQIEDPLRSLDTKGCIKIEDRSRSGHEIRVFLPSDLNLPVETEEPSPDLESIWRAY
jgi:hypothetical protein